jgi:TonB family protein
VAPKSTETKTTAGTGTHANATATNGSGNADTAGTRGGPGAPGGSVTAAEEQTYFKIVAARFNEGWNPPLTTVATGRDLIATLRIRVSSDGAVKSATMTRGTGNREVDASVEAAISRFTKVPPPPAGLLAGGVMDKQVAVVLDQ